MPIFAPRGATGEQGAAHVHITRALVTTLGAVTEQIMMLSGQIAEQLASHPDADLHQPAPFGPSARRATGG